MEIRDAQLPLTNEVEKVDQSTISNAQPQIRLHFLDGLRGLTAIYVMLSHTVGQVQEGLISTRMPVSVLFRILRLPLEWGIDGVAVFIVLSGFCLMLPIARTHAGDLRGGIVNFVKRRSLRILPPYYATVGIAIGWAIFDEISKRHYWPPLPRLLYEAGLTPSVLLSHLFLIHDFSPRWIETIEGPLWSIAVEWHIYFVFAFILLPLWKRYGLTATLSAATIIGFGPVICFHYPYNAG